MVFIRTRVDNGVEFWHYKPELLDSDTLESGYLVESIPEYSGEVPAGKMPELHYDGKDFSWVMVDKPVSEQDALRAELDALKAQLAEIQAVQSAQLGAEVMQNANS